MRCRLQALGLPPPAPIAALASNDNTAALDAPPPATNAAATEGHSTPSQRFNAEKLVRKLHSEALTAATAAVNASDGISGRVGESGTGQHFFDSFASWGSPTDSRRSRAGAALREQLKSLRQDQRSFTGDSVSGAYRNAGRALAGDGHGQAAAATGERGVGGDVEYEQDMREVAALQRRLKASLQLLQKQA